jgi:hypothetical protein
MPLRPSVLDRQISALDEATLLQGAMECSEPIRKGT